MSANTNRAAADAPAPRRKRWLQNLILASATFFVCIGLSEAALRLAGYGHLEIYEPDQQLYWKLKPSQDCFTKVHRKRVHINSHGTRGPEFSADKPANTIRILSLGDSRTFGWGLADEETYSRKLEQLLREFGKGNVDLQTPNRPAPGPSPEGSKRVEVINAGVNAWSYSQMRVFYRDFAAAWKPDLVILGEANPWTQFSEKNSPGFAKQFMGRVRLKNFLRRFAIYHFVVEVKLQEFYMRHRTKFIPVDPQQDALFKEQQQSDPDAVFRSAIEGLCQIAGSNGVKTTLIFVPTLDELQSTNRSPVLTTKLAVSSSLGIPLVDLTPELKAGGKALYLEADPVHLNAAGNALVAQRLFETMTNQFRQ
jgi:hypothetical protein